MQNSKVIFISALILLFYTSSFSLAQNRSIPRYITLKFNEVNVRTGPAFDCPIAWVYTLQDEVVEVIAEYENWRKIRDIQGEGGWIHSSTISKKRGVIIQGKTYTPLLQDPNNYDNIVARLAPEVRCKLLKIKNDWCQIKCQHQDKFLTGWISKKFLWGVYPNE